MSFFERITNEEWEKKYKKIAEEYDKKELEHALSQDMPLTGERLQKIAKAQKKEHDKKTVSLPPK